MGNLRCPDRRAIRLCQPRRPSLAHYGLDARRPSRPKHGRLRHNLDWRVLHRRLRKHTAHPSASPTLRFLRVKRRRPQRHLHLSWVAAGSAGGPPAYFKVVAEGAAPFLVGTRPWRVRWRCGILPRRFLGSWLLPLLDEWSSGEVKYLATKNTEVHKERVLHAPLLSLRKKAAQCSRI